MDEFDLILEEIQKRENLATVAALADKIKVSAAQLSRIKNKISPLSDETIEKICNNFKDDVGYAEQLRIRLKKIQSAALGVKTHTHINDALEDFHNKFFETKPSDNRIICFTYRDLPQSRDKGKNPEYIQKSASVIKNNNLACALFQCFGPLEEIRKNLIKAAEIDDTEAIETWGYIHTLAKGVHEVFEALKKEPSKSEEIKGQIVLYEAIEVPGLVYCDIHSRLMYSEKLSPLTDEEIAEGRGKIRIVQLIMGKDENNINKEYFIECITDLAFQSVVATQFYPILHYWRATNGKLPTDHKQLKEFVKSLPGNNRGIPWNIYA